MMHEPTNPYAAPQTGASAEAASLPARGDASMVNQLTIVGILQIVLGAFEAMMGTGLVAAGFMMASAMASQPPAGEPPPEMLILGIQIFYWVAGASVLFFGLMRIASGIGCFRFRGRIWLIISLLGGLSSVLTCYCGPFSIGMCIYGMIVCLNSSVIKAYKMGSQGVPPAEIKHRFMAEQLWYPPQPPPG